MKTETVILDFDGTMGDSQHLIVTTLQATIGECRPRFPNRSATLCGDSQAVKL